MVLHTFIFKSSLSALTLSFINSEPLQSSWTLFSRQTFSQSMQAEPSLLIITP